MKSTRSSMFNRRRHLFSPRSVADLDTTAQVVTCCCQDCSPIGRRVVDAKIEVTPRHVGTRACQPHAEYISRPLSNYTQPLIMVVIPRTPESCAKHLQSCTVFKASVIGSRPAPTVVATSPLQHCVPTCWRKVCLRSWVIWKYTATGLVGVPDCRSPTEFCVHEQVYISRRLIFCSRRFNMSSWLASSLPLGADSLPTTFQLHTSTHHARQLIGYRFQTAHVSMPTFPIQKTRHDLFRLREKIVAGFSNLERAPDHTRLHRTLPELAKTTHEKRKLLTIFE